MSASFPTAAQIAEQAAVDAEAYARIQHDYDPTSFFSHCEEHHNEFLTYCVICPEDTGNGKISEAALAAQLAERDARWIAEGDVPF